MSLKKIQVDELRLGMFVVGFEGSWLSSPFWRSKILLDNPGDVRLARNSGLRECWIDTAHGLDVPGPAIGPASTSAPSVFSHAAKPKRTPAVPARTTFADELKTARMICKNARASIVDTFSQVRLGRSLEVEVFAELVGDIVASVARHPGALVSLVRLKTDDDYTYMHSIAVCALMVALANKMRFSPAMVREAGMAGLLHDIGKAKIPLHILNKPGRLDDTEFATVKRHPEHGYEALTSGGVSPSVREVCLHHHERMDGSGYPHGLFGENIPPMARMGAVCDVYDAITSERPYKKGWDPADALAKMVSWQGHFDPKVLSAFIEVIGIYPTGSLVRLKSDRIAVVMEQNAAHYTRPVVRVFYDVKLGQTLTATRIDLAAIDDVIIGPEARDGWPASVIESMWAGEPVQRRPP